MNHKDALRERPQRTENGVLDNRPLPVTVVVPTYHRESVLLDTIDVVLEQDPPPAEVLIVDQSPTHEATTSRQLHSWHAQGQIHWIRLTEPSIPKSMNHGLALAREPIVLFLDDDVTASPDLVSAHATAHGSHPQVVAVVGQVLQPGEISQSVPVNCPRTGLSADLDFPFFNSLEQPVANVMAGNLSVKREFALQIGGFDENFTGVAYRFESEFARRLIAAGGEILFCPSASINHLRADRGGTRSTGSHLTSADPKYGIGDYYFAFLCGECGEAWRYALYRMYREVRTKFHLTHPWWIPVKLVGELRAMYAGYSMAKRKRREARNERR
ncbi:MAG: glycosyltransferase family 2 protein [Planctomycetaceae bacterium]|nr:glycosyltransferase family 2 protein [Planctomycetaceae bacterium]MCA9084330.1 glycosyltransferase family 2 protein [Planctomycetaceae bacterium]